MSQDFWHLIVVFFYDLSVQNWHRYFHLAGVCKDNLDANHRKKKSINRQQKIKFLPKLLNSLSHDLFSLSNNASPFNCMLVSFISTLSNQETLSRRTSISGGGWLRVWKGDSLTPSHSVSVRPSEQLQVVWCHVRTITSENPITRQYDFAQNHLCVHHCTRSFEARKQKRNKEYNVTPQ